MLVSKNTFVMELVAKSAIQSGKYIFTNCYKSHLHKHGHNTFTNKLSYIKLKNKFKNVFALPAFWFIQLWYAAFYNMLKTFKTISHLVNRWKLRIRNYLALPHIYFVLLCYSSSYNMLITLLRISQLIPSWNLRNKTVIAMSYICFD